MSHFIGNTPEQVANGFIKRYFYGLRRNDDGELFLVRVDQLAGGDANSITIKILLAPAPLIPVVISVNTAKKYRINNNHVFFASFGIIFIVEIINKITANTISIIPNTRSPALI